MKYNFILPEQYDKKVQRIILDKGDTKTEIFKRALDMYYSKLYPTYLDVQVPKNLTPEEKIKAEMDLKEARIKAAEEKEYREKKGFCDAMGGVEVMKGKTRVCQITKYHYNKEYKSEVPFEEMSQEVVDSQFEPDKKTCIEWGAKITN